MSLDEADLKVVIDAVDMRKTNAGEFVIEEGEPGEVLYIVESGDMSCTKIIDGKETFLKKYAPGDVFGELALLYNAPRAATIKSDTNCELWSLDRGTFNHIVKDSSQKKR
jgi:cAMP-dependent protein kinase regulator